MAVVMRLSRMGRKGIPFYRIVVADSRMAGDGRIIERIGHYDPRAKEATVGEERALYWLKQGAKPSSRVKRILLEKGIWERFDEHRRSMKVEKEIRRPIRK